MPSDPVLQDNDAEAQQPELLHRGGHEAHTELPGQGRPGRLADQAGHSAALQHEEEAVAGLNTLLLLM